jgi:hypothetical protein
MIIFMAESLLRWICLRGWTLMQMRGSSILKDLPGNP